jgi:DNA repair protein RadC
MLMILLPIWKAPWRQYNFCAVVKKAVYRNKGILSWDEQDRPREKLIQKGRTALSDAELLAILLGSGSAEQSAVDLARDILQSCDHQLHTLAKKDLEFLKAFKGIGEAKAINITAALELGRRHQASEIPSTQPITSSALAYKIISPVLSDLQEEEFWIIYLNRANHLSGKEPVSKGGIAGTYVDVKSIFKRALQHSASGIILAHNHPSGNIKPSQADISITKKINNAGDILEIKVWDHIIVGTGRYFSFADEGLI